MADKKKKKKKLSKIKAFTKAEKKVGKIFNKGNRAGAKAIGSNLKKFQTQSGRLSERKLKLVASARPGTFSSADKVVAKAELKELEKSRKAARKKGPGKPGSKKSVARASLTRFSRRTKKF